MHDMSSDIANKVYDSSLTGDSAVYSFTSKNEVFLDECGFIVRDYTWEDEREDAWRAPFHLLDLSLTPRPQPSWGLFLDQASCPRVSLGRLMFVPAGCHVKSGAAGGRQRSLSCFLKPALLDDLLSRAPSWKEDVLHEALRLKSPDVEWLLLRIYQELSRPGFASQVVLESMANAIGVALIRRFGLDHHTDNTFRYGGLAPWRLRRIQDRAYADAPAPRLRELAELCEMSVRQLTRAFKMETGETIAGFVQHATIARAQALLLDDSLTVQEIAKKLGFANPSSFCSAYRRICGQRPTDFIAISQA